MMNEDCIPALSLRLSLEANTLPELLSKLRAAVAEVEASVHAPVTITVPAAVAATPATETTKADAGKEPAAAPRRGRPTKAEQEAKAAAAAAVEDAAKNAQAPTTVGTTMAVPPSMGSSPATGEELTTAIVQQALQEVMNNHPDGMDAGMAKVFEILREFVDDAGKPVKKMSALRKSDLAAVMKAAVEAKGKK